MSEESQNSKGDKQTEELLKAVHEANKNILTSINKAAQNETTLVRIEEQLKNSIAMQKQMAESLAALSIEHGKLKLDFYSQPNTTVMREEINAMKLNDAKREGKMSIIIQLMWAGVLGIFGLVYMILKAIGINGLKSITGG